MMKNKEELEDLFLEALRMTSDGKGIASSDQVNEACERLGVDANALAQAIIRAQLEVAQLVAEMTKEYDGPRKAMLTTGTVAMVAFLAGLLEGREQKAEESADTL